MGKNHRHTKKLKSERNKVHIKSKTKFLPKGQNVTNTAFKIKSIVIQEQLKDREAPGLLITKANVEELLSKLRHHNDSLRTEACQKLKDWISFQPLEATRVSLCSIIQVSSALIQDKETKVREAYIKLMGAILEKAPIASIRPHFTYILANFKCAMTNINKYIQEDSLLLLDAILEHQPALIGESFESFFPNFLSLISKLKTQTNERSLIVNLEGKVSSVKWRIKVLSRLYGILKALNQHTDHQKEDHTRKALVLKTNNLIYVPIYKELAEEGREWKANKAPAFHTQLPILAKLLDEIWMEVVPRKADSCVVNVAEATVLTTEDSIATFSCVVNVLFLLHEHVRRAHEENPPSAQLEQLLDHLMACFPYTHTKGKHVKMPKHLSKHFSVKPDPNFVDENLIIINMRMGLTHKNQRSLSAVGPYLNDCLTENRVTFKSISHLVKILTVLVLKTPKACQRVGARSKELVENLDRFCTTRKIPEDVKMDVYQILATSSAWVEKIPELLCTNPVSAKLIQISHELVLTNQGLGRALSRSLSRILKAMPGMEIVGNDLELSARLLVYMFYYVPNLKIEKIEEFVERHPRSIYSKYFGHVLEAIMSKS